MSKLFSLHWHQHSPRLRPLRSPTSYKRAGAGVRIEDCRGLSALPPTLSRLAPQNHIRVRHHGRFHSYITLPSQVTILAEFFRPAALSCHVLQIWLSGSPSQFAYFYPARVGQASTAPRFRLSPPRRVITPYLLLPCRSPWRFCDVLLSRQPSDLPR